MNTLVLERSDELRVHSAGAPDSSSAARGPLPLTADPLIDRYVFGASGEYQMRVATSIEDRRRAWELVYRVYLEKGYAQPSDTPLWFGLHDALPNTTTLIAEREGAVVAALTLVFDSPMALPADSVFPEELDALRRQGRRLCEIVSLVHTEKKASACIQMVQHLFKLAYIAAFHLEACTDFIITVNPHHAGYYEKRLLFTRHSAEKTYGKVSGAPALLLGLDLVGAELTYRERFDHLSDSSNFYRFFKHKVHELAGWLAGQRQPLDPESLGRYFVNNPVFATPDLAGKLAHVTGLCRAWITG
jgi:hypothetical protein